MPGQPLDQTVSLTGADAVKAQLADLAATGGASLQKLAQSAGEGQAGFDAFGGGVNNLAAILSGLSGNIGEIGEKFSGFGEILAAAAPALESFVGAVSLGGLYELASSAAEATHQIESLAAATGSTTENIQGFQYALASVGVSADTGTGAITKMLAFLGQADAAYQKAADSANQLAEAQSIQMDKSNLAVQSAQAGVQSAYNAYQNATDGISKAQVAADKAQISFGNLVTQFRNSNATGAQAATQALQLRDAQSQLQTATDGIAQAQNRAAQASTAVALAQERAALADKERQAEIDKINSSTEKGITLAQQYAGQWGIAGADLQEASQDGTEAFYKAIDGLKGITDAATRADVARAIFGRGWKELIPAIQAGGTALKDASDSFEKVGLALNDSDKDLASSFNVATREFGSLVTAIKDIFGDQLTQLFTPAITALNNWIKANAAGIRQAINDFVNAAKLIEDSFGEVLSQTVFPAVTTAVKAASLAFEALAFVINKLTGSSTTGGELAFFALFIGLAAKLSPIALVISKITGLTQLATAAWGAYAKAADFALGGSTVELLGFAGKLTLIGALIEMIIYDINNWDTILEGNIAGWTALWNLIQAFFAYLANTVVEGFNLWVGDFKNAFSAIGTYAQSWADSITGVFKAVGDFFSNAWQTAISFVESLWNGLVDWIQGAANQILQIFQPVFDFFNKLWSLIQSVTGASSSAGVATGWQGGVVHAAGGGQVIGAGTGRSDSIPAMPSNGEFVVQEPAVRSVGVGFLHALNSGRVALSSLGSALRNMWAGGFVQPQHFATGGLVAASGAALGGMAAVHLHLNGSTFSLLGERGVVQALTGAARKAAVTQTGRAPSWKKA